MFSQCLGFLQVHDIVAEKFTKIQLSTMNNKPLQFSSFKLTKISFQQFARCTFGLQWQQYRKMISFYVTSHLKVWGSVCNRSTSHQLVSNGSKHIMWHIVLYELNISHQQLNASCIWSSRVHDFACQLVNLGIKMVTPLHSWVEDRGVYTNPILV